MSSLLLESHGQVALLRLNNGVTNAINPQLVNELAQALQAVKADYRGLVISGGPKFFSIGFDLPALLELDRVAMTDFFNRFNKLVFDLYMLSMPTAASLGGHTIAGGSILALAADFRYASRGPKKIGLNEIKLGLPVPYLADLVLRQVAGDRVATTMIFNGAFMSMDEARTAELVDDAYPPEELEEQALNKIAEIADFDSKAFAAVKANRVEMVRKQYQKNYQIHNPIFIESWFDTSVQTKLRQAAKQF